MPVTIRGTSRQTVTTRNGVELQRQYIVLPEPVWAKLQAMCVTQHRSGSQLIEALINIASISGTQIKDDHARTTPSNA